METSASVESLLGFVPRDAIAEFRSVGVPYRMDIRPTPDGEPAPPPFPPLEPIGCHIENAREATEDFRLDTAGFTLIDHTSAVKDWRDNDEVIGVFYEECKQVARALTGAQHVFTFDHVRREGGLQVYGGGLGAAGEIKSDRDEGAYVSMVHLDYTDRSEFNEYLALHGVSEPEGASRVVMLNFWRPIFGVAERDPLAVCDARTIRYDDILELNMLGYLPKNYSWHTIGMNMAQLAHSPEQRWYYYAGMTPDEMLVMQTYDSRGIIGRVTPHGAFQPPATPPQAPARCSVELRVLCYI